MGLAYSRKAPLLTVGLTEPQRRAGVPCLRELSQIIYEKHEDMKQNSKE